MTWLLPGLVAASLLVGSHLLAFPAQWRERPGLLPAPALTLTMLSLLLWVLPVEGALPSIQWIPSLDPAALSPTGTGAWLVPLALLSLAWGTSLHKRAAPTATGSSLSVTTGATRSTPSSRRIFAIPSG